MKISGIFRTLLLMAVISFLSIGCPGGSKDAKSILKVIDHQTVRVVWEKGGVAKLEKMEKVRFFGVDVPRFFPNKIKAKNVLVELLEGKDARVFGEDPNSTSRDSQGAIFAHIIINDIHVNLELVRHGFSRYTESHSSSPYNAQFLQAQKEAEKAQVGVWDPEFMKQEEKRRRWGR